MLEALKGAREAAVTGMGQGQLAGRAVAGTGRLSKPQESLILNLMATGREFHDQIFLFHNLPGPCGKWIGRGKGDEVEEGDQVEATAGRS